MLTNALRSALAAGILLGAAAPLAQAQQPAATIHLNQVGFYPAAPKVAVVVGAAGGRFSLMAPGSTKPIFTGDLGAARYDSLAQQTVRLADFSACQTVGTFVLAVPSVGSSYPFQIKPRVHEAVAQAALKGFYYQRASTALPPAYAGAWARPAGHPDTRVLVHASAATAQRPAGTVLASPRGWYDAGDYNKYVVNSGITLGTLFSLYEDFPAYCGQLKSNIPESTNALPDVLDESLWNLRWLLTMQDPTDGGVYHKLTNASFDGMVMPDACATPRYVVQKSTAAALDFAAVLAQASRVLRPFGRALPGLADSCLRASTQAWGWARQHPATYYQQDELNKQFQPAIQTGAYGDEDVRDEWAWAATELYVTTKDEQYWEAGQLLATTTLPVANWGQVRPLAYYTLLRFSSTLTPAGRRALPQVQQRVQALADSLQAGHATRAYGTVMGHRARDYNWGSSAEAANQGIALIQAYRLSGERPYLLAALTNLDYLLGRNATGYSFVTGSGSCAPQHPHHRPSEADGIAAPVPGLLVGGPNPGRQDKCAYPSSLPPLAYSDTVCSYASNEIAINWQAPLVYLAAALEALQPQVSYLPTPRQGVK
ncbi:glycoside hydrolase family 9 protein [Hymenobacter bucti]|uniref:Endoglucanase n=1 Tax=Hymenobacter bucti TaxID=1844114 RepID=A0ABW4R0Q1_9BACT